MVFFMNNLYCSYGYLIWCVAVMPEHGLLVTWGASVVFAVFFRLAFHVTGKYLFPSRLARPGVVFWRALSSVVNRAWLNLSWHVDPILFVNQCYVLRRSTSLSTSAVFEFQTSDVSRALGLPVSFM